MSTFISKKSIKYIPTINNFIKLNRNVIVHRISTLINNNNNNNNIFSFTKIYSNKINHTHKRHLSKERINNNIESIKIALKTYRLINNIDGLLKIPFSFIVPIDGKVLSNKTLIDNEEINWPKETWGLKLGQISKNIGYNNAWKDHRIELEKLGINYNNKKKYLFNDIYKAFETYKRIYHNNEVLFSVPQNFIVPCNDNNWSKETWGMKLGSITNDIRSKKIFYNKILDLKELGFDYNPQIKTYSFEIISESFNIFKKINNINGLFSIRSDFEVPYNDNNWPIEMWGMKLGYITSNIRHKNTWKNYRLELEKIGLDYLPRKLA
jgi:hypothetical protein